MRPYDKAYDEFDRISDKAVREKNQTPDYHKYSEPVSF